MSDVLPLKTLEHVKDVTMKLAWVMHEPQWPDTWDQLTSITRLELDVWYPTMDSEDRSNVILPFSIESLVEVKVSAHYTLFEKSGEEYLLFLTGSLPVLSRLQLVIVEFPRQHDGSLESVDFTKMQAICMAVQLRTPGLKYDIFDDQGKHGQSPDNVQLDFTLQP